jgi:carbonic anhydrase/acetyltransferase-like protein (isoleucine patch superfamily)
MASALLPHVTPFILPFEGTWPRFASEPRLCGTGASVLGRVTLGTRASLGAGTVIRADGHFVRIGDDFHLGEMSTVHIAHEVYPAIVGDRVAVGRDAVVHACTVGDDCVIEDGVVVLDGSVVENGVLIEAGSTIFPRSTLNSGFAYAGSPAKPVRELAPGELEQRARLLHETVAPSLFMAAAGVAADIGGLPADVFVGRTARLAGRVELAAGVSILFGCRLDAAQSPIAIGTNTNVQDNTRIDASEGEVVIGPGTTIGHNVQIRAGRIGAHALIGIGADLAAGTIVDDDVLLAAGATTTPQQQLEGGWLWGGRPARPLSRLNDTRRAAMQDIVDQYRGYGAAYRAAQDRPAGQGGSNGTSPIADRHPHR